LNRTLSADRWCGIIDPRNRSPAPDATEVNAMDALLVVSAIVIVLATLAALGAVFGVDSRDGFADDRRRSAFS
jgi:hypothetical protein